MIASASLLYAYAVLPPEPASALPTQASGDGPEIELVTAATASLAVSRVPAEEFGEEQVQANLGDEAWVSRLAMTHFDVVGRLFELGPVLPLRLCTLFRSVESAMATLDAHGPVLEQALARLTGAAQWSVRVRASRKSARAPADVDSGTSYLQGLAQARRQVTQERGAEEQLAAELADRLSALAIDVDAAEAIEPGVLHAAAYLVRDDDRAAFLAAAHQPADEGTDGRLEVDVRGPWPPYSFVPPLPEPA